MMLQFNSFLSDPIVRKFFTHIVVYFVVLSVLLGASWLGYKEMNKELKREERPKLQTLNALRSQVKFLQQQVRLYEQYGDKYQALVKKGLVKKQDRVFWTDSLIKLRDQYIIPDLSFSFSAEKPLANGQFSNIRIPNGIFYYSRVKLKMSLQHEEDLLRIFEKISLNISPLYLVESCKAHLLDSGHEINPSFNLIKGNISTDCSLIVFHTHPTDKNK